MKIHIQKSVEAELEKLMKEGHIDNLDDVGEDVFVSPVVITRNSDGSVKIALDSVELNKQIVRKRMQMPMLAELLDQVSIKITSRRDKPLLISTIDLKLCIRANRLGSRDSQTLCSSHGGRQCNRALQNQKGLLRASRYARSFLAQN